MDLKAYRAVTENLCVYAQHPIIIGLMLLAASIYWLISSPPPPLQEMTIAEKKARFKKLLVPAVNKVYLELKQKYSDVAKDIKKGNQEEKLAKLRVEYKVKTNQALLVALKPHPRSIAIAQAALESSWATSRFFIQANNVFGVWSFDKDEPRMAAGEKRGSKTIWVKKYPSIAASVKDYYRTLARGNAYQGFRKLKMTTNDPFKLVTQLHQYSEQGAKYAKELKQIIKFNKFTQYDKTQVN